MPRLPHRRAGDHAPAHRPPAAACPRFSITARRAGVISAFTASTSDGRARFGIGGDGNVHRLVTLEVLEIGVNEDIAGADADQLGAVLQARTLLRLGVVDEVVHRAEEVGEFQAQNDIRLRDTARAARVKRVQIGEIHPSALIDNGGVQRFRELDERFNAGIRPGAAVGDDAPAGPH